MSPLRLLKGRSAGELRERGAQWWAARLERWNLSALTRLPADEDVPAPRPDAQSWPPPLPDGSAYRRFLDGRGAVDGPTAVTPVPKGRGLPRRSSPEGERRRDTGLLLAAAEGILAGRVNLLGLRDVAVGTPVDWHRDPDAGITSPRLHWSRIRYLDPAVSGDHKVVWEINRHQWFLTLGRAWRLTGDARYAECFVRHLASWMDDNPPKTGINWASSLEVWYPGDRLAVGLPALRGIRRLDA